MRNLWKNLAQQRLGFLFYSVALLDPALTQSWLNLPGPSQVQLTLDHTQYFFDKSSAPGNAVPSVQARVERERSGSVGSYGIQAVAIYQPLASLPFNFDVQQLYGGFRFSGDIPGEVSLGKKKLEWSSFERLWMLGIFEPRFYWDPLWTESSGLLGAFYQVREEALQVDAWVTPASLPELGLLTDFSTGKVVSPSRWFKPVAESLPLLGNSVPIQYSLSTPALDRLLLTPGVGLRVSLGHQMGFSARFSYAYKAVNQLQMLLDGGVGLQSGNLQVTLTPRRIYHHVAALESGYRFRNGSFSISGLAEIPIRDQVDPLLTTQRISPALSGGPTMTWEPFGADSTRLTLGYLLSAGGDAPDEGPLADPNLSAFDRRYAFKNAGLMDVTQRIPLGSRTRFHGRLRTIADLATASIVVSPLLSLQFEEMVSFGVGGDLFATATTDFAKAGFLGQSLQNSRIYGRLTYGF